MKSAVLLLSIVLIVSSCEVPKKIDLSSLKLNEPVHELYNVRDTVLIGIETIEYPYGLIVDVEGSDNYTYEGIDLEENRVMFLINAEVLKTDSITRFGGAHYDMVAITGDTVLNQTLSKYKADQRIYGVRMEMKSPELKSALLHKIQSKYGEGTKNPNTENGLYWNIGNENKLIFFAPDYDRLIILNNTHLSKTCYWDSFNGMIDLGGCDQEKYLQSLIKNSTKPEDVKNKPRLTIDQNWSINNLVIGKSTEEELMQSKFSNSLELTEEYDGATRSLNEISYQDKYHDVYFFLSPSKTDSEDQKNNIIQGYSVTDFKKVDISFDNHLKPGMKMEDVIKLFDPKQIMNYQDLKISNYLEIDKAPYKITLTFDENNLLSAIFFRR